MKSYADKTQENKKQSISNAISPKRHGNKSAFTFVDNRPEAVAQKIPQEMVSNSPQTRQAIQLEAMTLQDMTPVRNFNMLNDSTPVQRNHTGVIQLMPWYAKMALGASAGAILGATGLLAAGPALALGITGAALGVLLGNGKKVGKQVLNHGTAEERIKRMHDRGIVRRDRERIPKGRYNTPTGPTTISGLFRQRMTQSRQEDYGGETFGSVPSYQDIQNNIPDAALPLLSSRDSSIPVLTDRQRLATSLSHSLVHGSEEDRVPGTSAYFRAINRDYVRTQRNGHHPLSTENFPARRTAQEQRDLMEGRTKLSAQQRRALEVDSGESSDEDERHYIQR